MSQLDLSPYQDPRTHEAISEIIRRHSSNPEDVRFATFRRLDLDSVEEVLDLGCGFGFMAEELARRISPAGRVTGMDACPGNEGPFRDRVTHAARRVRWRRAEIDAELPWSDHGFDLAVCSFSLYFFDRIIPEVARVLKPEGLFVALTHSEGSFLGLLRALGLPTENSPLVALVRKFSAESGASLLNPCFDDIERIDYSNTLTFTRDDAEDLMAYLRFKMPLIAPSACCDEKFCRDFELRMWESLDKAGYVIVEKNDAIFICRSPRPV